MADKLYGNWIFKKDIFQSSGYRAGSTFTVNFICNGVSYKYLSYVVPNSIEQALTSDDTIELIYAGPNGSVSLYDSATNEYYSENASIFITDNYDDLNNAEALLKFLKLRATHIPESDVEIVIGNPKGVVLQTKNKKCVSDIRVIPETEEVSITENGEYVSSKVGYNKIIVNVPTNNESSTADKYFEGHYTNVNLPNATSIKPYGFYNDVELVSITMPKVTKIGDYAFYTCANLSSAEMSNLTDVGVSAFYDCTKFTIDELPNLKNIATQAFYRCSTLALKSLPEGITAIGGQAFYKCSKLALTSLPSTMTSISNGLFYECLSGLKLTELPSGLITIDSNGFRQCTGLRITEIPASVTSIGSYAFYKCTGITSLTFKGTPTTLNANAFSSCTNIKTINVPWKYGEVSGAPWGATNATINYGVSYSIGLVYEFDNDDLDGYIVKGIGTCTDADLVIPYEHGTDEWGLRNVTKIAEMAFRGCTQLTSVTIPDSVTSIGDMAFDMCPDLITINCAFAEGAVPGAPWGGSFATINYNYTGE